MRGVALAVSSGHRSSLIAQGVPSARRRNRPANRILANPLVLYLGARPTPRFELSLCDRGLSNRCNLTSDQEFSALQTSAKSPRRRTPALIQMCPIIDSTRIRRPSARCVRRKKWQCVSGFVLDRSRVGRSTCEQPSRASKPLRSEKKYQKSPHARLSEGGAMLNCWENYACSSSRLNTNGKSRFKVAR